MSWTTLTEALVSGIATAATWAGIVTAFNFARNARIRRQLGESLKPLAVGLNENRITLLVSNPTSVPVVVRSVGLRVEIPGVGDGWHLYMAYGGSRCIGPSSINAQRQGAEKENEFGFVEMPPGVTGEWWLSVPEIREKLPSNMTVRGCFVTFEHRTIWSDTITLTIWGSDRMDELLQKFFTDCFPPSPEREPAAELPRGARV